MPNRRFSPIGEYCLTARTFILTCHAERIWLDSGNCSSQCIHQGKFSISYHWYRLSHGYISSSDPEIMLSPNRNLPSFHHSKSKSPTWTVLRLPVTTQNQAMAYGTGLVFYVQSSSSTSGCSFRSFSESGVQRKSHSRHLVFLFVYLEVLELYMNWSAHHFDRATSFSCWVSKFCMGP